MKHSISLHKFRHFYFFDTGIVTRLRDITITQLNRPVVNAKFVNNLLIIKIVALLIGQITRQYLDVDFIITVTYDIKF